MREIWRACPPHIGLYEASNLGRVRRTHNRHGRRVDRVMKPGDRRGYVKYSLTVDAVPADVSGHRLVWETFNGPIPAGLQINHKNGVKNDNRLENLEVCTQSENLRHRHRTLGVQGTKNPVYGERNGKSKLRREDIEKIRSAYIRQ
jgi:hypothetical protein